MLRITVMTEAERTVLKAEGKLSGPWVKELDQCWRMTMDRPCHEPIVIDLSDVAFVDAAGKDLMRRMCDKGMGFIVKGPLMITMVNEMKAEAIRQLECSEEVS